MSDDVPSDVQSVLTQLFDEGETAIVQGEYETARQTVRTARTVSRNKLPDGDLRTQLLHGCDQVTDLLTPADGIESDIAAEYLRAMERRLVQTDR